MKMPVFANASLNLNLKFNLAIYPAKRTFQHSKRPSSKADQAVSSFN